MKSNPAREPKKIFLVEDRPAFHQGIIRVLNGESDLRVCGSARSVGEALSSIARIKPELVLVEISLPGKKGLRLIKEIRSAYRRVKLVVISTHQEADFAAKVLRGGGDGYVLTQEGPDEIVHAVRDILGGHLYVSEGLFKDMGGGSGTGQKLRRNRSQIASQGKIAHSRLRRPPR